MISAAPNPPSSREPTWAVEARIENHALTYFFCRCILSLTSRLRPPRLPLLVDEFIRIKSSEEKEKKGKSNGFFFDGLGFHE